jgi:methionyl-tRNA formyltransferase
MKNVHVPRAGVCKRRPSLIVLASDYVGCKIVEYLISRGESIDFLILDSRDIGGHNNRIEQAFRSSSSAGTLATNAALQEEEFLDRLSEANPRLGILAWWPRILKGRILTIPSLGWLNFHPSYLPYNRGKHPNFWCLVDQTPCGVSLHYIDESIDAGEIVARQSIPVSWEDTGETIYRRSRDTIVELFKRHYDDIVADRLPRLKVAASEGTLHPARDIAEASRIELDKTYTARQLLNIIRARMFPPHPTAFFHEGDKRFSVEIVIKEVHGAPQ